MGRSHSDRGASARAEALDRRVVITRHFDAPRELVWKAWTEGERMMRWWGPAGFTSPVCRIDLRVGGRYLLCMRSPGGEDRWTAGAYREVVEPERIVCTQWLADEKGRRMSPALFGLGDDWPEELLLTVSLVEDGGGTGLTLEQVGLPPGEISDMTAAGWKGAFDKLAEALRRTTRFELRGDREIVMTRLVDAPRELVFRAYIDPQMIPRWWGPARYELTVDKMDVRPGGAWRFVSRGADGVELGFHGVYREVVPPERLVSTFEFEGAPGHVSVDTLTLEDRDGKTLLTATTVFESGEERDGMVAAGMESGAVESWERLAGLVERG